MNKMDMVDEESCIFTKSFLSDFESSKNSSQCPPYSVQCNCNPHTSLNFNNGACLSCNLRLKDKSKLDDQYWSFLTEETSWECNKNSCQKFPNERPKDLFCLGDTKNSMPQSVTNTIVDIKPSQTTIENGQMAANSLESPIINESTDDLVVHQSDVQSPNNSQSLICSDDDRLSDISKETVVYKSDNSDLESSQSPTQENCSLLSDNLEESVPIEINLEESVPAQVKVGAQTNSKKDISSFTNLEKESPEPSNLYNKRISRTPLRKTKNLKVYKESSSDLKLKIRKISLSDDCSSPVTSKVTSDTGATNLFNSSIKTWNSNKTAVHPVVKAVPPNPTNNSIEIEYIGSQCMNKETQSIRDHAKTILIEFVGHYKIKTIYDDFLQLCRDKNISDIEEEHTLSALDRNIRRFVTQIFIRKHFSLPQKAKIRTDMPLDEYLSTLNTWHQKIESAKS